MPKETLPTGIDVFAAQRGNGMVLRYKHCRGESSQI